MVSRTAVAKEAGMNADEQRQAIRVANVPDASFGAQVESDNPPTIQQLAEQGTRHRTPQEVVGDIDPLTEFNIVRQWRKIGEWRGAATELSLDLGPQSNAFDACAIILQDGDNGPIRGATAFRLPKLGGSLAGARCRLLRWRQSLLRPAARASAVPDRPAATARRR
jgi:hypothetical protein